MLDSFGNMSRLLDVEASWLPFANSTKAAVTCANVTPKHERCCAIRPAFEDVWTTGLLTDRVKVQALDQLQDVVLFGGITQTNTQPLGFGLTDSLIVTDYRKFAGQLKYLDRILHGTRLKEKRGRNSATD
jgi:hypothetical protein